MKIHRSSGWALAGILLAGPGVVVAGDVDFEDEVRPILAEKCTLCHGPDDAKGGLRLTNLEEASRALKSGRVAVVPGEPEASEMLARVHSGDPEEIMPPPDAGDPLTEAERDTLRRWVASGADWPRHWAYETLSPAKPPALDNPRAPVRNPVDAYVLKRLAKENIEPSPEADPTLLIRRLHYDLVGLPPAPERTRSFLSAWKEDAEAAYAALVDELLASPRFGERWGRHWLDRARYADSDGYEKDNHRADAWRYRDWVIQAINEDMPFDRFTIEQFAGDLLDDPTPEQVLATAFHRQTLTNTEGGVDKEQWRVAAVMDRVETVGAVWMGLTLSCARCHTHKYDEITHAEYYQLYAYFNNGDEEVSTVARSREEWERYETALAAHEKSGRALRTRLSAAREDLQSRLGEWEKRLQATLAEAGAIDEPSLVPLAVEGFAAPKGVMFAQEADGSVLVGGENPPAATYNVTGKLPPGTYTGLRLEVLPDDSLAEKGPGRAKHGNFVLNHLKLTLGKAKNPPLLLADADASHSQSGWQADDALDEKAGPKREGNGWAVGGRTGQAHHADFGFATAVELEDESPFTLDLVQNYGDQHTIGRFRLFGLNSPTALAVPGPVRAVLETPPGKRSAEQQETLARHVERLDSLTRPVLEEVAAHEAKRPAAPEMQVRVLREREEDRRATHVFNRGEFKETLDEVQPGTLASLPPIEHRNGRGDRLDLARWLVGGENPLPPRVVANDIWMQLFGEGIVPTPDDFGVRGDRPSHPELLEWLALELVRNGWSRKALIRQIVLSSTYRQSSEHRPELREIDPKNRLLARQNRFRVEAEIIRDLSLAAAGLLSDKVGGPSVFPPIPEGVADVNYNSAFQWKLSEGEDRYRRGIYTYFKRTAPHPGLITFDCPDSNVTALRRARSNTPLAALITLNSESFAEAAQAFARRILTELPGADDAARLQHAFHICLAREASPGERDRLASLLESSRSWYRAHAEEAAVLTGEHLPEGVSAPEAAAWIATLRIVLNLDEFITRG